MTRDQHTQTLRPTDGDTHPAVRACAQIGIVGRVAGLEVLEEKRKTRAYRLRFDGGRSVIAKLQPVEIVRRERTLYTGILPHAGVSVPDYFGSLVASSGRRFATWSRII